MSANKCSTAAVNVIKHFTFAWEWRVTTMGSACAVHTNACVIASKVNRSENSLTNPGPNHWNPH